MSVLVAAVKHLLTERQRQTEDSRELNITLLV